ncbi:hypothetical protein BU23DRAFT_61015 [Bimuria novae-zelandiae CBS 107.79]|uniref:Uncharacterized protein n=1 Tax=Bimuria novae-zelandiae CBS 107.79 TaxID=1447943 RepID=A0A6A5VF37_9PLEO|nr:hypothetical protein BU23DRAFT_61015 [Bimuria novae-zelandiae CBS 107.79]
MEVTRRGNAGHYERVADAVKGKDGVPPPSKQPISAAGIFKQNPKSAKRKVAPASLHRSAVKKPTMPGLSSSPRKVERNGLLKQDEVHPLAAAFNDTTQAYRNTLYESTTKRLDDTLCHLVSQLQDYNLTTTSSPPRTSDPTGSPQKITLAEKVDRIAEKLFRRLGSYRVTGAADGSRTEQLFDDRLAEFETRHEVRVKELRTLETKWESAVSEIWKIGINYLGEDATHALLLLPSIPSSPPQHETDSLDLEDLEPRPARKKVKFQEPIPELPKFLSSPSNYPDLPVPMEISKEDIKKLESKVDVLGDPHIEELINIKKQFEKKWQKKVQLAMNALKED